jgi:hypothetical protein
MTRFAAMRAHMSPVMLSEEIFAPDVRLDYTAQKALRSMQPVTPLTFEFTHDVGYLHQYFALRAMQADAFDEKSEIIVARRNRHCLAGGRLTVNVLAHKQQMPLEKDGFSLRSMFPELKLANRAYAEISQLAILGDLANDTMFPELTRRLIRRAIAEGAECIFNASPKPQAEMYQQAMGQFGLKCTALGEVEVAASDAYEGTHLVLTVAELGDFAPVKKKAGMMVRTQLEEVLYCE